MDPLNDENLDEALVFIDNSNVFIETQKYSARKKEYLPDVQDSCCRIDYRKIIDVACEGKFLLSGRLYGSEPPPLKKVWEAIRRNTQISIHRSKRNIKSKEKAVDTALIADAVELIITKKNPDVNQHFILFSGDRDMIPVVQKAIKYGWHVHVWAYANSMSDDFHKEKRNSDNKITIHDMKDYFGNVTFSEHHFKEQTIPKHRSLVLTFSKISYPPESTSKDAFAQKTVETASSVLCLPTQGRFLKEDPNKFLVVVYPEETAFRDYEARKSYEFNSHVFNKKLLLRTKLEHCTEVQTYLEHSHTEDYTEFADHVLPNGDADMYREELRASGSPADFSVVRRKQKKNRTKYSDNCKYGFTCVGCNYTHSEKEEEYFKDSGVLPENRWKYKTAMCHHRVCRFKERRHVCSFAHDISELRCRNCKQFGHEAANCPEQHEIIKNVNKLRKNNH